MKLEWELRAEIYALQEKLRLAEEGLKQMSLASEPVARHVSNVLLAMSKVESY